MSSSTETLAKLRALTSEARTKANVTIPSVRRKVYKPEHSYNVRVNRQDVVSACEFGGNYSFRIPSHNQICGEFFLELNIPALAGNDTYKAYPLLQLIKNVTIRTGNKVL